MSCGAHADCTGSNLGYMGLNPTCGISWPHFPHSLLVTFSWNVPINKRGFFFQFNAVIFPPQVHDGRLFHLRVACTLLISSHTGEKESRYASLSSSDDWNPPKSVFQWRFPAKKRKALKASAKLVTHERAKACQCHWANPSVFPKL